MGGKQTLSDSALVLLGHGSTRTPHGRARAGRLAEAVRQRGLFAEVATCFWKEAPTIDRALDLVTARGVLSGEIVPVVEDEKGLARPVQGAPQILA